MVRARCERLMVMTRRRTGKRSRHVELRKMLEQRRDGLIVEMQGRIRDVRTAGGDARRIREAEAAEPDQEDIELTIIQLKSGCS